MVIKMPIPIPNGECPSVQPKIEKIAGNRKTLLKVGKVSEHCLKRPGMFERSHPSETPKVMPALSFPPYLEVFRAFQACGVKRRKEWCTNNHINLRAMMKALDIYKQLSRAAVGEAGGSLRTTSRTTIGA